MDEYNRVTGVVRNKLSFRPSQLLAQWSEIKVNDIVVAWNVPEVASLGPVSGIKTQSHNYTFLVNGIFHGWVQPDFADLLRVGRRSGQLNPEICICRNDIDQIVEFFSDGERPMRPLMRCEGGELPNILKHVTPTNPDGSEGKPIEVVKTIEELYNQGIKEYWLNE